MTKTNPGSRWPALALRVAKARTILAKPPGKNSDKLNFFEKKFWSCSNTDDDRISKF